MTTVSTQMTYTEGPVRGTQNRTDMLGAHSCTLFALQMDCAADLLPVTGSTEDAGLNRGNLSQEHRYCDEEDVFQEMSGSLASQDNVLSEQQVWASESQQLLLKCPLRSGSLCTTLHRALGIPPSLTLHTSVARREVPVSSDLKKPSCGWP